MDHIPRSELRGFQATLNGLDRSRQLHLARLTQGVAKLGMAILGRSQHYCPVSEDGNHGNAPGTLKLSGHFGPEYGREGTFTKATGVTYAVTYNVFYAVYVHENTAVTVRWHTPGTGAKFLERAVAEVLSENNRHVPWSDQFEVTGGFQVLGSGLIESRDFGGF